MKKNLFIVSIVAFTCTLLASCNGGGSSANPTPSPSVTAKYAYIANDVGSHVTDISLCNIDDYGVFTNCKLQTTKMFVNSLAANSTTLYVSYFDVVDAVYTYLIESSNGSIDVNSAINNSSIGNISYISIYNNYIYVANNNYPNYQISNCILSGASQQTISSCLNFSSSEISLNGASNVAITSNGYAYFITNNQIAQCKVNTAQNGSLTNCTTNNSLSSAGALNTLAVTDSYAYIFNSDEKSINVCPITANGTLGTCQKQQPVNSAGQNMMGATAISPIVRNNRLFFVNSAPDAATSSAVVSCPISANGLLGACTTSATSAQFASPQAMTMI